MLIPDARAAVMMDIRPQSAGFSAIENAVRRAKLVGKRSRYRSMLRVLPDWFLDAICNVIDGDQHAASVLIVLTHRVGWLIHDTKNPCLVPLDPKNRDKKAAFQAAEVAENEEIMRAAPIVMRDCGREKLRRMGLLREFDPNPDPFGLVYIDVPPKMTPSRRADELEGEHRKLFDFLIAA